MFFTLRLLLIIT